MTNPSSQTREVFQLMPATAQRNTTVLANESQAMIGVEHLVAYLYEDLQELVRWTGLDLPTALDAPPEYVDDPFLFLRLLCADIEQLLNDRLITGVVLVLSTRSKDVAAPHTVHYCATYQLGQSRDPLQETALAAVERTEEYLDAASEVIPDPCFTLMLRWNPLAIRGHATITHPQYHLDWVCLRDAQFSGAEPHTARNHASRQGKAGDLKIVGMTSACHG